ncbi:thiamine/thiamine pyrophosphate ABC transporter permease ThiP [Roseobacter sp. HKCCA0434]|uniref:thiamine/thiamine pyrophosphate ABC transporter permease ThiP n=1 Tax=Roseobacter sp. HKCCA0434 TaxID=3079297 RepID=UPI002905D1D6|nr:thiamine/thiamine pyrophosphate ABC transporter permease ThiP [Roseobacter sp. HKCCA0434]
MRAWPGLLLGGGILVACLAAIAALVGQSAGRMGVADFAALRFTLVQAVLSTVGSVLVAVPLARALARRSFPGREWVVTLMGAPFLLPTLVAVIGLLSIWGRNGALSELTQAVGLGRLNIYGLVGVVLAHMFYNIPLVTRLVLQGWATIPAEHVRLSRHFGFDGWTRFRVVEWPMLRAVLPGAALLVFLLCITSFAIALTLGGGPRATTLELAIYQAIRFEFDLGRAGLLALVQTGLCLVVAAGVMLAGRPVEARRGLLSPLPMGGGRLLDVSLIGLSVPFLGLPLLAVIWRGVPSLWDLPGDVGPAALRSILVAVCSAAVCIAAALTVAMGLVALARRLPVAARLGEGGMLIVLAISPFVLATGWFILLRGHVDPFAIALPMVVAVNALMALPFALRALVPAIAHAERTNGRLARTLGLRGLAWWRHAMWPDLKAPLGFAAGLAAALSMGDLGVIALFGTSETATLPLVMYQLMGSYRMDAAAACALLLLGLSFALFAVFDRIRTL